MDKPVIAHGGYLHCVGVLTTILWTGPLSVHNSVHDVVSEMGRFGGGGWGWHNALVFGSVSLWRRLLASRL